MRNQAKAVGGVILSFAVGVTLTFFLPIGVLAVVEALILIAGSIAVLTRRCC